MTEKGRDHSIDILRGIATVLVIVGHIPYTPFLVRAWIYTFHVPLFFLCSGLLFSPERNPKFKPFLLSRVKGLLLPILTLGILTRILQVGISWLLSLLPEEAAIPAISPDPVKHLLSLLLGWRVHDYYYSLWFLYALFLGEILFFFLVRLLKKRWYFYVLLMIAGIALQYVVSGFVRGAVWSVDTLPAALAFLSGGYLYRITCYEKNRKLPRWLLPVLLAVSFLFFWLNLRAMDGDQVNLFYGQLGNPAWYFLTAASGCATSILIADLIQKSRLLEFFGRNSLVAYAFQNTVAIPLMMEILTIAGLGSDLFKDNTFRWIFTVTGTLLLTAAISTAINRFAPFLLGKKKVKKEKMTA